MLQVVFGAIRFDARRAVRARAYLVTHASALAVSFCAWRHRGQAQPCDHLARVPCVACGPRLSHALPDQLMMLFVRIAADARDLGSRFMSIDRYFCATPTD